MAGKIQKITIRKNKEGEVSGIKVADIEKAFANFVSVESWLLTVDPDAKGGNHAHPRREAFVIFEGEVTFVWQDESGQNHLHQMNSLDGYDGVLVPPLMPHGMVNKSDKKAIVLELADGPQRNVKRKNVV